jgi:hypothetical protein
MGAQGHNNRIKYKSVKDGRQQTEKEEKLLAEHCSQVPNNVLRIFHAQDVSHDQTLEMICAMPRIYFLYLCESNHLHECNIDT